jgi:hypothetical protein
MLRNDTAFLPIDDRALHSWSPRITSSCGLGRKSANQSVENIHRQIGRKKSKSKGIKFSASGAIWSAWRFIWLDSTPSIMHHDFTFKSGSYISNLLHCAIPLVMAS